MNYFSMFSGIGGFELGIERAYQKCENFGESLSDRRDKPITSSEQGRNKQPQCIGYSEVNKYAIQVYEQHFKGHKNYGDATKINANELPDFDLLVGGFPCQSFSIAGKRLGFGDTRGTLFYDIARILSTKRPRYFLLENVKGLLSHNDGKTFQTILEVLTSLGYCVEWQVLNSKDFGVPQNRERVFFSGHLGIEGFRKVFPIGTSNRKNITSDAETSKIIDPKYLMMDCRIYNDLCPTMASRDYKEPYIVAQAIKATQSLDRAEKRQNGRRMKEDGEPSFTLTSQDKHGVFDGYRIRRLTPTECERLQGFPDGWTESLSDSQRYKCLGNAVTVNVIEAITKKIFSPNAD